MPKLVISTRRHPAHWPIAGFFIHKASLYEREIEDRLRNALDDISSASIIYRHYLASDLSAPASPPYTLSIKSGHWTAMQVQITAGYLNVLDLAWPRYRYTLNNFPALRYMR
ncbi:DUF1833 family protein [Escherichia coli]